MNWLIGAVLLAVASSGCATASAGGDDSHGDGGQGDDDGGNADAFVDPLHGWQPLGGALDAVPTAAGYGPFTAIGPDGEPIVAFVETGGGTGSNIYVYRWTGTTWMPMGGAQSDGEDTATATEPCLAVSGSDIYLAFSEYSASGGGSAYHIRKWSGTAWTPVAGTPLQETDLLTAYNSLYAEAGGKLWFASTKHVPRTGGGTRNTFVVRYFDGAAWTARGGDDNVMEQDTYLPRLRGGGGQVYLYWEAFEINVRRWDAGSSTWVVLGAPTLPQPAGFSSSSTMSMAVRSDGQPLMAFHAYKDSIDGTDGFLDSWNGSSWEPWGTALQGYVGQYMGQATYASMNDVTALPDGRGVVAWSEQDATGEQSIYVDRCSATADCAGLGRQRISAVSGATSHAGTASLATDPHGRVVMSWSETDGTEQKIYVWRYHGDPDTQ